ncbi:hypothetical protein AM357_27765 (plasmid) [Shigella sonnei]|nr:hypothetical protein AM357_27765 [Shigella sonnei]
MRQQQDEQGRFSICSRQAAVVHAIRQVTLQQEYIRGRSLSEIIHFRPGMSERSQERLMETLENSERHWPARRKHMFFQIFMAQHICRDAVEIHWANGNIQVIRPVRGISMRCTGNSGHYHLFFF